MTVANMSSGPIGNLQENHNSVKWAALLMVSIPNIHIPRTLFGPCGVKSRGGIPSAQEGDSLGEETSPCYACNGTTVWQ